MFGDLSLIISARIYTVYFKMKMKKLQSPLCIFVKREKQELHHPSKQGVSVGCRLYRAHNCKTYIGRLIERTIKIGKFFSKKQFKKFGD
jgi:hypothetical protein